MDMDDLMRELGDLPTGTKTNRAASTPQSSAAPRSSPTTTAYNPPPPSRPAAPASSAATASSSASQQSLSSQPEHARRASASNAAPAPGMRNSSLSSMMDDLDLHIISPSDPGITPRGGAAAAKPVLQQSPSSNGRGGPGAPGPRTKCAMLFLGGTRYTRGRNGATAGEPACCDALRCTKCDFRVVMAKDRSWADDANYLFFRNNYPDDAKLAPMHRRAPGSCAYCCQCSWVAASDCTRVDFGGDLRWVCAGHC